jgi:hypothetical protein
MTKIEGENLSRKGMGRPKGSQNKVAKEAKEAIAEAAAALGGSERLADWAKESPENEKAFWQTIYPKLVGVSVSGSLAASLIIETGVPRAD